MSKKLELSDWDWTTLVAAWRYYEYGHTIASAQFPEEVVTRFFGKASPYSCRARKAIADQFANTDHGLRGEEDWSAECAGVHDGDRLQWTKFYRFCKGYVDGFAKVRWRSEGKGRVRATMAFRVDWKNRWYPVEEYVASPWAEKFIPDEWVVEVKQYD